jgi:hypothetical protein
MCPLCISSMALTVAGATSTGAVSTFMVRRFARIVRKPKTQQPDCKETIHHDDDSDRAPKRSSAR